jgi:hypothetical protein
MRYVAAAVLLCAATVLPGCAVDSSVGPTPPPASTVTPHTGALTVRVLTRTTEQAIAGATVQSARSTGTTDALGICILSVTVGEEVDVDVSAPGYETMGASGVLGSNERWTFYLRPSAALAANR